MYLGGFYPLQIIKQNGHGGLTYTLTKYIEPPKRVYKKLFSLVENKNYFVITTNVDH